MECGLANLWTKVSLHALDHSLLIMPLSTTYAEYIHTLLYVTSSSSKNEWALLSWNKISTILNFRAKNSKLHWKRYDWKLRFFTKSWIWIYVLKFNVSKLLYPILALKFKSGKLIQFWRQKMVDCETHFAVWFIWILAPKRKVPFIKLRQFRRENSILKIFYKVRSLL